MLPMGAASSPCHGERKVRCSPVKVHVDEGSSRRDRHGKDGFVKVVLNKEGIENLQYVGRPKVKKDKR